MTCALISISRYLNIITNKNKTNFNVAGKDSVDDNVHNVDGSYVVLVAVAVAVAGVVVVGEDRWRASADADDRSLGGRSRIAFSSTACRISAQRR